MGANDNKIILWWGLQAPRIFTSGSDIWAQIGRGKEGLLGNILVKSNIRKSKFDNVFDIRKSYIPVPHDAMLHTCDGVSKRDCDVSKSRAMCCDRKTNMLNNLVPILEYLSYLSPDFQTVFSIVMGIP